MWLSQVTAYLSKFSSHSRKNLIIGTICLRIDVSSSFNLFFYICHSPIERIVLKYLLLLDSKFIPMFLHNFFLDSALADKIELTQNTNTCGTKSVHNHFLKVYESNAMNKWAQSSLCGQKLRHRWPLVVCFCEDAHYTTGKGSTEWLNMRCSFHLCSRGTNDEG